MANEKQVERPVEKLIEKPIAVMGVYQAICGLIRAWMVARDAAISIFLSGDDPRFPLTRILLRDEPASEQNNIFTEALDRMNNLRGMAQDFAAQIEDENNTSNAILAKACADVLSTDRPKFYLHLPELPNSF